MGNDAFHQLWIFEHNYPSVSLSFLPSTESKGLDLFRFFGPNFTRIRATILGAL